MAGTLVSFQTVEIPLLAALKTGLQILAPANHRVKVKEISVSFDGITNTGSPILVQVIRQTTAGLGGDVLTGKKFREDQSETVQTTGLSDIDGTTQPTATNEVMGESVHPQGGFTWQAPFGGEIELDPGTRLGIQLTAGAAVNAKVRMVIEE